MYKQLKIAFSLLLIVLISSCATYYQRQEEFNKLFINGNFEKASKILDKNKKAATNKNKLLYFLNQGTLHWLMGNYEQSNTYFNQADLTAEDYNKSVADYALSYLSNPMSIPYRGEDFEVVLLHYYKALNYLNLGNYESALVEARRINLKVEQINQKFKSKNKYNTDAFGLMLMGLIYDASGEYNNAFVAYRNAYNAYEESYSKLFGISAPKQLKEDLLRAAYRTGFPDQVEFYENKFGMKFDPNKYRNKGELVFFWNNGLGPVKAENSINFTILPGSNGNFTFVNEEYGINIPYFIPAKDTAQRNSFSQLKFVRIAFPKYVERPRLLLNASLKVDGNKTNLEEVEDINQIAFKSLKDRMLREISDAVIRLAVKKAAEFAIRKENQNMGTAVGIFNALTEKADTRNWQTLPYSISYTRVFVDPGEKEITFSAQGKNKMDQLNQNFKFNFRAGRTVFHAFQSNYLLPTYQLRN